MRRRSFNRPKEKLRGISRRLNALDKWADSFQNYFPSEYSGEKYWNWKIPILDRMVDRPTTTKELQQYCANALLKAASYIETSKPKELESAIVTVLLTYPDMFDSEICVFFNTDYFDSFYEREGEEQNVKRISNGSLAETISLSIPKGFEEVGYQHTLREEWEGEVSVFVEEWWSYVAKGNLCKRQTSIS